MRINPIQRDFQIAQSLNSNSYMKCRKNIAITLFYSTTIFIASCTGNQVQIVANAFGYPLDMTSLLFQLLLLAVYLNGCINPFIYIIKYKRFRSAAAKQYPQICSTRRNAITLCMAWKNSNLIKSICIQKHKIIKYANKVNHHGQRTMNIWTLSVYFSIV